jgi:hypothetical protein
MNAVSLVQISDTVAELQWSSSTSNDMIADSALALLLGIDTSPATVKRKPLQAILRTARIPIPTTTPTNRHQTVMVKSTVIAPLQQNSAHYPFS